MFQLSKKKKKKNNISFENAPYDLFYFSRYLFIKKFSQV